MMLMGSPTYQASLLGCLVYNMSFKVLSIEKVKLLGATLYFALELNDTHPLYLSSIVDGWCIVKVFFVHVQYISTSSADGDFNTI